MGAGGADVEAEAGTNDGANEDAGAGDVPTGGPPAAIGGIVDGP